MPGGRAVDDAGAWRLVARIGKPHGLRGEVTVQLHTDDPAARLAAGSVLSTEAAPGSGVPRTLTVRSTRVHQGVWLVGFEQVPDRTGAESLRGTRLVVPDEPPEPAADVLDTESEDAWYEEQLVGLQAQTPAGEVLGTVSGLELGAAQDLLVLTLTTGRTAYVPFVSALVPTVDVAGGRVVVDPPPGLLDLDG